MRICLWTSIIIQTLSNPGPGLLRSPGQDSELSLNGDGEEKVVYVKRDFVIRPRREVDIRVPVHLSLVCGQAQSESE
jgi:hypothetical protein